MNKRTIKIFFPNSGEYPLEIKGNKDEIEDVFRSLVGGNPFNCVIRQDGYKRYINPKHIEQMIIEEVKEDE